MSLAQVLLFDIMVSHAWNPQYVFESKGESQCQGETLAYLQCFASPEFCLVWISINYTNDTQVMSVHMSKEVRSMQTSSVDVIAAYDLVALYIYFILRIIYIKMQFYCYWNMQIRQFHGCLVLEMGIYITWKMDIVLKINR